VPLIANRAPDKAPQLFGAYLFFVVLGLFALLQSILYFEGIRRSGIKSKEPRTYAFYNALSDPGMVCGAVLSGPGSYGFAGATALVLFAVFLHARHSGSQP